MSLISRFAFVLFCVCVFICLLYAFLMLYILFFSFFFPAVCSFFVFIPFLQFPFLDLFVCVFVFVSQCSNLIPRYNISVGFFFYRCGFCKKFQVSFFTGLVFRILVPTFFKRLFQRVSYLSASKAQRNAIGKLVCPQQNKI